MTLPHFEKYLDFVLLDRPVEILEHVTRRKFKVVAVATGSPISQPFWFALAVDRGAEKYRLTILSHWHGGFGENGRVETEWVESRKVFFSPWVKKWLANHPEQLIEAGIGIGHAFGKLELEEHFHNIFVKETVREVVAMLREKGLEVDYIVDNEDPEEHNGYICPDNRTQKMAGIASSCIRWRREDKKLSARLKVPKNSMTCIQLLSSAKDFDRVRQAVESTFKIIQKCDRC